MTHYTKNPTPGTFDHTGLDCPVHGVNVPFARPVKTSGPFFCVECRIKEQDADTIPPAESVAEPQTQMQVDVYPSYDAVFRMAKSLAGQPVDLRIFWLALCFGNGLLMIREDAEL